MTVTLHRFSLVAALLIAGLVFSATSTAEALPRISYVSIPVTAGEDSWNLAGKLSYPLESANGAAVLLVHGSGGVDTRGALHTKSLNAAGFVTLEIDLWAARGWLGRSFGRPASVPETLPDVFAALNFLNGLDGVDADRIGVAGFSWGGVIAMLARSNSYLEQYAQRNQFAANVAFYPVCWVYNKVPGYELTELLDAPLLILTGELDDYDTPTACADWRAALKPEDQENVDIVVYPQSYHGFNTSAQRMEVTDPFSHQGKGGVVVMEANDVSRAQADQALVDFFNSNLGNNDE